MTNRKADRKTERAAQVKLDHADAAQDRKAVRMILALRQLDMWFPDNLDLVKLAAKGDETAVYDLIHLDDHWGDPMVALMLGRLVPDGNEGMRKAVRHLWTGHRRSALEHLKTREAQDLLRRYGTKPDNPPKEITIYRGGHGYSASRVAAGWSWTTDPLTAAFFIDYSKLYTAGENGPPRSPYLLKATIKASQIVHVDAERGEDEVVVFGIKEYEGHGTPDDWQAWREQHEAGRLAELKRGSR